MNKLNKIILWIIGLIVVIGLIWLGYSDREVVKEEGDVIRIGAILPITGIAKIPGQNSRQGVSLAVEEINNQGGINGKLLEVIFEDDGSDAKNTVSAVQKLISIDEVGAIIGPTWDFQANAVIPVFDQAKKIAISPSVLGDTIEKGSPYFFTTFSPVSYKKEIVKKFLGNSKNQKVGILTINNPWGLAHLETYKKAILETENELAKEIILPNFDNNQISSELAILKGLELDIILTCLNDQDQVNLVRKIKELDIKGRIFSNEHLEIVLKNNLLNIDLAEGFAFNSFSSPTDDFFDNFVKKYDKEPGLYADTAYDAVYILVKAIEKYGTDSDNIIKGLKEIEYTGASGNISFKDSNFPSNKSFPLMIIQEGKFIPYQPQ